MNDEEILIKVKNLLGMAQNSYQDDVLTDLIQVVKSDMVESGVSEVVVNSDKAIGCIMRGVIDNWNYGNGGSYSDIYFKGVIKLREIPEEEDTENV